MALPSCAFARSSHRPTSECVLADAARANARHIVNTLASRHRVLIGTEGPAGNVLKLRPPMTFCREHADLLLAALEAAAAIKH